MTDVKLPELPEWVTEIRDQAGIAKAFRDYARAAVELNRVVVDDAMVARLRGAIPLKHAPIKWTDDEIRAAMTTALAKE